MKNGGHGLMKSQKLFRVLRGRALRRTGLATSSTFMVRSRRTPGSPCHRTVRLFVFEPLLSKEVEHEWAVTGLEGTVAADGRGVPRARRQASRTGRSPARTRL